LQLLAEILFVLSSVLILNSFFIYPLVIFIIGMMNDSKPKENYEPEVSILIAVYNEEKVIRERIENISLLNYDFSKLEVIIGSDKSNDGTNGILEECRNKYSWLKIYHAEIRSGKAGILNAIVPLAAGEIIVLTDANTEFQKDALKNLVKDFHEENVGGVCGKLILQDSESIKNSGVEEASYWQYETFIKTAEGSRGISLAANGGIFAIRKKLFRTIPIREAVTDDLFISLSVIDAGYKFTYCKDAVAYESTGKDIQAEYIRKVRFSATNYQTFIKFTHLLSMKNPLVSYAFLSHKVTRWHLPFLLFIVFAANSVLAFNSHFYFLLFSAQCVFYVFSLLGYFLSKIKIRIPFFSLPYFFTVSNIAVLEGFWKFINKKHSVIWESTAR
jgi:poly-beta-1,6-N-acetyl-D-glucosamine synthase